MTPKISIITPTYNQGQYIEDCIKSVIAQTYSEWEMIIVDDHTQDDTRNIVHQYMQHEKRITYIQHTHNWGIPKLKDTYNQALKQAKGEYIAILEGDDMWPRNKLEVQLKAFDSQKVVLAYGDWVIIDNTNRNYYIGYYKKPILQLNNSPVGSILGLFAKLDFSIIPVTMMIRKSSLDEIGGFQTRPEYPFIDVPTIIALAQVGEFKYQQYILGYYRKHSESTWYLYAKNTKANFRHEIRDILNKYEIRVDAEEQDKIINLKSEGRTDSIFLHSIVLSGEKESRILAKKIVRMKKGSNKIKLIAFLWLCSPKLADITLRIMFLIQYMRYICFRTKSHE